MRVFPITDIREVDRLTPRAPRCFESRDIWVEFVAAADAVKENDGDPRPFIGGVWNPDFHPCTDCTGEHRNEMLKQRRCTPFNFPWTTATGQASLFTESAA